MEETAILASTNDSVVLDGFVLLEACHSEFPDRAYKAELTGKNISQVVYEDMIFFKRLSYADFGDNQLSLEDLSNLQALEELHLQCNGITRIVSWTCRTPFPILTILDLSYNSITPDSILSLAEIPRLRELDLTGNDLEWLPNNIKSLKLLELLCIGQNKLSRESCILSVSQMPRLRELDASENKFSCIPEDIDFPRLEWFNLSKNNIKRQEDVTALTNAPELLQVILYGNPLSKQQTNSYRAESKYEKDKPEVINLVTDMPSSKRISMKVMYSHFQIAKVEDVHLRKPSEWRAIGNNRILDELESKVPTGGEVKEESKTEDQFLKQRRNIFMTEPGLLDEDDDNIESQESDLSQMTSTSALRERLAQYSSYEDMMPNNSKPDSTKLRSALNGLRYALKHPLTSHNKSMGDSSQFEKATTISKLRQKPRIPYHPAKSTSSKATKNSSVLTDIDRVLDRLDTNFQQAEIDHKINNKNYQDETDRTVDGLINSVHNVIDKFDGSTSSP